MKLKPSFHAGFILSCGLFLLPQAACANERSQLNKGAALQRSGDLQGAIGIYDKLIPRLESKLARALNNPNGSEGSAVVNDLPLGIGGGTSFITLPPYRKWLLKAIENKAICLTQLGQDQAAIETYTEGFKYSQFGEVQQRFASARGSLYEKNGDRTAAENDYRSGDSLKYFGMVYSDASKLFVQRRYRECIKTLEPPLRFATNDSRSKLLFLRARAYAALDLKDEAGNDLSEAVRIDPTLKAMPFP